MRSPSKRRLRPSPGELERKMEEERTRRRKQRLLQVRQQSQLRSTQMVENAKSQFEVEVRRIGGQELKEFQNRKRMELEELENQYRGCLADIGLGKEGVREHVEYETWKKKRDTEDQQLAQVRGSHALKRTQEERNLNERLRKNKTELRKSVLLAEKLRTTQLLREQKRKQSAKVNLIEYDGETGRMRSKLVPQTMVLDDITNKENSTVVVKRNNSGYKGEEEEEDGFRQARNEIEREKRQRMVLKSNVEMAKLRKEEDRKAKEAKEEYLRLYEEESKEEYARLYDQENAKGEEEEDEVDFIPVREVPSKIKESTPVLKAKIQRAPELMGLVSDKDREVEVEEEEEFEDTVFVVNGPEIGKKTETVNDFISKVLNFNLKDPNFYSKISSSSSLSSSSSPSSSSPSSSSLPPSSASSSTFEKSKTVKVNSPRHKSLVEEEEEEEEDVGKLIKELRDANGSDQDHLRSYIEKLLRMKREEIDELSVTESTITDFEDSTVLTTPSTSNTERTPTSILSSCSSSSSSSAKHGKTVRFSSTLSTEDDDEKSARRRKNLHLSNVIRQRMKNMDESFEEIFKKAAIIDSPSSKEDRLTEGLLSSSPTSSTFSPIPIESKIESSEKITSSSYISSSRVSELKDKILNMKIPVLPRRSKGETTTTTTSTFTFTTSDFSVLKNTEEESSKVTCITFSDNDRQKITSSSSST